MIQIPKFFQNYKARAYSKTVSALLLALLSTRLLSSYVFPQDGIMPDVARVTKQIKTLKKTIPALTRSATTLVAKTFTPKPTAIPTLAVEIVSQNSAFMPPTTTQAQPTPTVSAASPTPSPTSTPTQNPTAATEPTAGGETPEPPPTDTPAPTSAPGQPTPTRAPTRAPTPTRTPTTTAAITAPSATPTPACEEKGACSYKPNSLWSRRGTTYYQGTQNCDKNGGTLDALTAWCKAQPGGATPTPTPYTGPPPSAGGCPSTSTLIATYANNASHLNCYANVKSAIESNLTSINFLGMSVSVHNKALAAFNAVNSAVAKYKVSGSTYKFPSKTYTFTYGGTYSFRCNVNASGNMNLCNSQCVLSNHSYGIAIDLNPSTNCNGCSSSDLPTEIIAAFESNGFRWGGRYKEWYGSTNDPMHFEYLKNVCN